MSALHAMPYTIHMACCHLANRLALTVSENELNIANCITDFHKLDNRL